MVTARRRRAWADVLYTNLGLPAGGSVKTDLLVGSGAPVVDTLTAVRIVGDIYVHTSPTDETEYSAAIDIGIGVSSAEAFALGVTALPDPNTAGDYPPRGWLYVSRQYVEQALPTGGTPTAIHRKDARFQFDIRAMRKIDKGVLFAIWRNTEFVAPSAMALTGRIRTLCLT